MDHISNIMSTPKESSNFKTTFKRIVVTGTAGSGKSLVCDCFKTHGLKVVDSDELARRAVAPGTDGLKLIVDYFGEKMLTAQGSLNRRIMRQTIIKNTAGRKILEQIIHPEIQRLMQLEIDALRRQGKTRVVVEIPLLFELNLQHQYDVVIVVVAPDEIKIKRLMQRDHVSAAEAQSLLNIQISDKVKAKHADYVIKNDGSKKRVIQAVERIVKATASKKREEIT